MHVFHVCLDQKTLRLESVGLKLYFDLSIRLWAWVFYEKIVNVRLVDYRNRNSK